MLLETPVIIHSDSLGRLSNARTSFYCRKGKRIFDCMAAGFILLLISPLLALVSVIVKLTSPGPVFYVQERVGHAGRLFKIIKFRSMVMNADRTGPGITRAGDARITGIGRLLRKLKLDELPQLWNVVRGDMSLVGPRPELSTYVSGYDTRQKGVLNVRPGITDIASIAYRWEEELLSQNSNPEQFYREVILPQKLDL